MPCFLRFLEHTRSACEGGNNNDSNNNNYNNNNNNNNRQQHIYIGKHASNIQELDKWYEHEPVTVTEIKEAMILWDMQIHTDGEIAASK